MIFSNEFCAHGPEAMPRACTSICSLQADDTNLREDIYFMDSRTKLRILPAALALAAVSWMAAGCSSGGANNSIPVTPTVKTGSAFITGTDDPMASVVSFAVQIQSVDAIDSNGNGHPLISGSPTV